MQFDPTQDHYGSDLSQEENRIKWLYWEFLKSLVTLASPAAKQKEIIGPAMVADELALDFDSYYTGHFQLYLDHQLLTENQVNRLNSLDKFFEDRSGGKMPAFWENDTWESNPEWEEVRKTAQEILADLGYENLTIHIERTTKRSISDQGQPLVVQLTRTRLRKKGVD